MLTDGQTVGNRIGGRFVPGQGWQATSQSDGIDYDIPTCNACTIEWDVTAFGKAEGRQVRKDLKWLAMGDATTWGSFGEFRNHPWKMHLEQRGDGNGTGMKLIWRNGRNGDGDPGDHDTKIDPTGIDWRQDGVFHFTVDWHPGGYQVWVGEIQNGTLVGNRIWFAGSFNRACTSAESPHLDWYHARAAKHSREPTATSNSIQARRDPTESPFDGSMQGPEMARPPPVLFLRLPRRSFFPQSRSNLVSTGCDAKCRFYR